MHRQHGQVPSRVFPKTYLDGGDYVAAAAEAAGELYGYGHTDVLFKPTKAAEAPFRPTAAEAMSYFVGHEAVETAAAGVAGKRASKGRTSLQAVGVGINGFGRIGRQVARIAMKDPETELKLINASYDADYLAYMMKYDTIHGKYDGTIEVDGDSLVIDGQKVALSHTRDPAEIPFGEHGAEYVCESTGNREYLRPLHEGRVLCLLHYQRPGPCRACLAGEVRHQARPDDHLPRHDCVSAHGGWHLQEGLAWWPRRPWQHHSELHRRRQGSGEGHSGCEGQADRHGFARADHRCVRG